jgi:AraC family transcriptional regulator
MTVYIKNMVCVRCKMAVRTVLETLNIAYTKIELGKAELKRGLSVQQRDELDFALRVYELELMEDKRKILVERIKTLIVELFHSSGEELSLKFSAHLSRSLHYDYTYLSNVFSELEGSTIEKFYITQRIERVKELIVYEGLSVTEIAYRLNFSSASHLCLQFKKVTGQTPSNFKKLCATEDFVWRK